MNTMKWTVLLMLCISLAAQADTLYLRDGWDMFNNVQDTTNGYSGTRAAYGLERSNTTVYDASSQLQLYQDNGGYDGYGAAVLDFALPEELDGATVESAVLRLVYTYGYQGGNTLTWLAREPDASWVEGEATYYYSASDVPWPNYPEQMRMDGPDIDTKGVAGTNMTSTVFRLDVTSLVQQWVADPTSQNGIAVTVQEWRESWQNSNIHLASKGYSTVDWRPMLQIEYTPEPTTLSLLGGGLLIGLLRRKRQTV